MAIHQKYRHEPLLFPGLFKMAAVFKLKTGRGEEYGFFFIVIIVTVYLNVVLLTEIPQGTSSFLPQCIS